MRLTRTVDLTGVAAAAAPTLQAQLSFDIEPDYDHVIVEAHTVGQDNWTTLAEAGGLTTTAVPAECEAGYLLEAHPFLLHYLTPGDPCAQHRHDRVVERDDRELGRLAGRASFDLSAFAGQQVEVSITFVTDPAFAGTGVFIDDTRVVVGGDVVESEGFESGLGPWTIAAAAAGQLARARASTSGRPASSRRPCAPRTPCCSASVSSRSSRRVTGQRSSGERSDRWG